MARIVTSLLPSFHPREFSLSRKSLRTLKARSIPYKSFLTPAPPIPRQACIYSMIKDNRSLKKTIWLKKGMMLWNGMVFTSRIVGILFIKIPRLLCSVPPYGINRNTFPQVICEPRQIGFPVFTDRKSSVKLGQSHASTVLLGIVAKKQYPKLSL